MLHLCVSHLSVGRSTFDGGRGVNRRKPRGMAVAQWQGTAPLAPRCQSPAAGRSRSRGPHATVSPRFTRDTREQPSPPATARWCGVDPQGTDRWAPRALDPRGSGGRWAGGAAPDGARAAGSSGRGGNGRADRAGGGPARGRDRRPRGLAGAACGCRVPLPPLSCTGQNPRLKSRDRSGCSFNGDSSLPSSLI